MSIGEGHEGERTPFLSVVIPAYNEARRIPSTLARLREYFDHHDYPVEILVVSNGSSDGTEERVRALAEADDAVSLRTLAERGKGLAVQAGVAEAHGEVIFICDADLSMPAESIARFLEAVQDVDVVVGSREVPGANRYGEPSYRHVMGRVFNALVKLLAIKDVEDTQCGFKAFRALVAKDLFSRQTVKGWAFDVEILYLARKFGYTVRELPIDWYFDEDSRVRAGADTLSMLGELMIIRLRDALGRYDGHVMKPVDGEDLVR